MSVIGLIHVWVFLPIFSNFWYVVVMRPSPALGCPPRKGTPLYMNMCIPGYIYNGNVYTHTSLILYIYPHLYKDMSNVASPMPQHTIPT